MIHSVTKQIDFCYGHRLINYKGKCANLHGHNAVAEIRIDAQELDHRGMVVDFGDINAIVKTWINEELDHKMLLNKADPILSAMKDVWGQPCFIIDGNPTAENIAKVIYDYTCSKLGLYTVASVTLWETPNSFAVYSPKFTAGGMRHE